MKGSVLLKRLSFFLYSEYFKIEHWWIMEENHKTWSSKCDFQPTKYCLKMWTPALFRFLKYNCKSVEVCAYTFYRATLTLCFLVLKVSILLLGHAQV
jgi:hypothetical protein